MKHDGTNWIFSSGRIRYGHGEKLSIEFHDGEPAISHGYDSGFWDGFEYDIHDSKLTREDLLELANHQIEQWKRFSDWLQSRTSGEP